MSRFKLLSLRRLAFVLITFGVGGAATAAATVAGAGAADEVSAVPGRWAQAVNQLVALLYGNQWPLDRYCNDTRATNSIIADDAAIEALVNGTHFGDSAAGGDGDGAELELGRRLEEANALGALARRTLSIICSIGSWGYASAALADLSNRPHENAAECAAELRQFGAFVDYYTTKWTAPAAGDGDVKLNASFSLNQWQQFNAFGRFASGRTYNNDLLLGDYDDCARLPATRYCLGAYGRRPARNARNAASTGSSPQQQQPPQPPGPFKIGLCLPRSCSPRILRENAPLLELVGFVVKKNLLTTLLRDQARHELHDVHCAPLRDSPWLSEAASRDLLARLLARYVPLCWLSLLALATFRGLLAEAAAGREAGAAAAAQHKRRAPLWRYFDLRANWRSFCQSAHADARLAGLNGAKVLSMNWLLLTHISMSKDPYLKDLGAIRAPSYHAAAILQGQHLVPVFFIISGILIGLKHLKRPRQPRPRTRFWNMLVARYLRLAPMYLVAYAYVKKFAHLTNDGPLWDYGVSEQSEARQCMAESWLVPLLMLANFTPPFAQCIITGWHISNDFQIVLLLPLLFALYNRWRAAGRLAVMGTFALTHASHVWLWQTEERYGIMQLFREPFLFGPRIVLERVGLDYVNPLGRVGTYFMGVLVADLLLSNAPRFGARQEAAGAGDKCRAELAGQVERAKAGRKSVAVEGRAEGDNIALTRVVGGEQRHALEGDQLKVAGAAGAKQLKFGPIVEESYPLSTETAAAATAATTATTAPTTWRDNMLASLGETALLVLGMQAAYNSLFTVLFPLELKLLFEPFSKGLAYPWVRLSVELGWSICLYYLLRDNEAGAGGAAGQPPQQQQRGAESQVKAATTTTTTTTTNKANGDARRAASGDNDENDDDREEANGTRINSHPAPVASGDDRRAAAQGHHRAGGRFTLSFGGHLLKLRFWNVLVKLNYTLMLLHYSVIRHVVQSQRQLLVFTWAAYFQLATFLIVSAYLLSLLVHLTIEVPLMALSKLLLAKVAPP